MNFNTGNQFNRVLFSHLKKWDSGVEAAICAIVVFFMAILGCPDNNLAALVSALCN